MSAEIQVTRMEACKRNRTELTNAIDTVVKKRSRYGQRVHAQIGDIREAPSEDRHPGPRLVCDVP